MKMQDVESRRALDLGNAPCRQKSDIQLFAPAAEIEVPGRAAAGSQRQAERAADKPIAQCEIAAEINMRGFDRRHQRESLPEESSHRPMTENA